VKRSSFLSEGTEWKKKTKTIDVHYVDMINYSAVRTWFYWQHVRLFVGVVRAEYVPYETTCGHDMSQKITYKMYIYTLCTGSLFVPWIGYYLNIKKKKSCNIYFLNIYTNITNIVRKYNVIRFCDWVCHWKN